REDGWMAEIKPPKDAESLSLKASAWDDEENKISQEIIAAYHVTNSGAADMQSLVEDLAEKGEVDPEAKRMLDRHLTTLKLFEEKGNAEKVTKHLTELHQLLDYHVEEGSISERVYNILTSDAGYLQEVWQQ